MEVTIGEWRPSGNGGEQSVVECGMTTVYANVWRSGDDECRWTVHLRSVGHLDGATPETCGDTEKMSKARKEAIASATWYAKNIEALAMAQIAQSRELCEGCGDSPTVGYFAAPFGNSPQCAECAVIPNSMRFTRYAGMGDIR